jgi:hypothetical protein
MGAIDTEQQRVLEALDWVDRGRRVLEEHPRAPKDLSDELTAAVEALEQVCDADEAEAEAARVRSAIKAITPASGARRADSSPGVAVLFDIAHRTFYIFGPVFWPQDTFTRSYTGWNERGRA